MLTPTRILTVVLTVVLSVVLPMSAAHAGFNTVFFDDFEGDLSQWNLNHLAGSSVSISNGQMVVDADQGDPRGFLLTNYSHPAAIGVADLADEGQVFQRVSFDVISSNAVPAGELLIGAVPGSGSDNVNGTHTLSPLASNSGSGLGHSHGRFEQTVDFGPVGSGLNGTSDESSVGKTVRLDWVRRLPGEGQQVRRVEIYYDDILEFTFDEPVDASRLDFNAGHFGFYLLLNRDFTIDNFHVELAPEPASAALLGLGGLMMMRRRR
ncbi:MAG: hypothetical protein CMJ18_17160 [Phycisphaeraceae bacterium]|nr:hypothetical protein [Phycisphaeraceae bacterium]